VSETVTLREHFAALREADERYYHERDRRYSEVNIEREKALKIKETADLAALQLARDIQIYKDEKANELREQINRERGLYATKEDLQSATRELRAELTPVVSYVSGAQGQARGISLTAGSLIAIVTVVAAVAGVVIAFMASRGIHP
jgi:hypothetical protein